jgi:chromosome partitioning protein
MAKIVSFILQKGGCGKTTTTVNIGGYVASQGFKTLMVDMDPQGNMTQHFGYIPEKIDMTIRNVLKKEIPIGDAIIKRNPNLHVIPNNILTAADELTFMQSFSREFLLRDQLLSISNDYDYIFIDCPPSLGILSLNALCASHEMFITISPDYFPLMAIKSLYDTYKVVKSKLNKSLQIKGIGITMCDIRTNHARQVIEILEKNFTNKVYHSHIRNNVQLKDASGSGQTIFEYEPNSIGAADYTAMGEEFLLDHLEVQKKLAYYEEIYSELSEMEKKEIEKFAVQNLNSYIQERYLSGDTSSFVVEALKIQRNKIIEKVFPIKNSNYVR